MRSRPSLIVYALSLLLHGYIGWRLLPPLSLSAGATAAAMLLLAASALLVPAPLLLRTGRWPRRASDLLHWIGYLAMGVFSSLLVLSLLREPLLLGALLWEWARPGSIDLPALQRSSAIAVLALTATVSLFGLYNARRTAAVRDVTVPIAGLPRALAGFTIVQLTDVHVGSTIKRGYLERIVRRVNGLDADLVALTGDIVDGTAAHLRGDVAPLAELRSRHGTYYVPGNHEYYHGVDAWLAEWRRLGMQVLLNEGRVIEHGGVRLLIGGVADYSAHHFDPAHRSDPVAAARTPVAVAVKILLAHQPRSAPAAAKAGFDLQLSGHTHGGQFLPWNFFVPLQQPFVAGLQRMGRLLVYTSRGTGYWGPPLRFGAPSEITRLRLVPVAG
jgi:predicted MPP superfamily phosphohydrolase